MLSVVRKYGDEKTTTVESEPKELSVDEPAILVKTQSPKQYNYDPHTSFYQNETPTDILLQNIKVEAIQLPPGYEPTANYNPLTNTLTIGIPAGEKGDTPEPEKFDDFSYLFDGSRSTFPLLIDGEPYTPKESDDIIIVHNGNVLEPEVDYTVSAANIILLISGFPGGFPNAGEEMFGIGGILLGDEAEIPPGGTTGQIMIKASNHDGDFVWSSNYATYNQGQLADTSLQPADNISELTNDAGYITIDEVPDDAPVDSVAGKIGHVLLYKEDIIDFSDSDYATYNQGQLADTSLQPGDDVSDLVNNVGYLTEALQAGDNVSELVNDAGYLTADDDVGVKQPPNPTNLLLDEINDTVQVRFNHNNDAETTRYEIWRSVESVFSGYERVGVIEKESISSTMSFIDNTVPIMGTIFYRIYASINGVISESLTGTITTENEVSGVSNLEVKASPYMITVNYDIPDDSRFEEVVISIDAKDNEADLTKDDAILAYNGRNDFYTYIIPEAHLNKKHRVFVCVKTRI